MPDLAELSHLQMAAYVEQTFDLDASPRSLALRLVEVQARGVFDPELHRRQGFSLVFRGPPEPLLEQGLYTLHHTELGRLDIFLVPIGPDPEGLCYEAVFT